MNLRTRCLALILIVSQLVPAVALAERVREPVWDGQFYPGDARTLTAAITRLESRASELDLPSIPVGHLKALIMPHAGYVYAGLTAACAARLLHHRHFDKVIVMGPDHRVGISDAVISAVSAYRTPLGSIPLHPDADRLRDRSPLFDYSPSSDLQEHSIEVVLPYLQHALGDFRLVPVVMGPTRIQAMSAAIAPIIDDSTLLVVSTDLSHYLPQDEAVRRDSDTLAMIDALDARQLLADRNRACGAVPVAVLLDIARQRGWRPVRLHYSTSAAASGDRSRVVGYAAVAFTDFPVSGTASDPPGGLSEAQGQVLVRLARNAIRKQLGLALLPEPDTRASVYHQPRATFVTLTLDGRLRGCIGSLKPVQAVMDDVRRNAVNAAFHDPRFPPVTVAEEASVNISVSVLTLPQELPYAGAEDLVRKLKPGEHGVIISSGWHRATFLPQVWEQLPAPDAFLSHLCAKAGLPSDAWRHQALDVQTYRVVYFNEPR